MGKYLTDEQIIKFIRICLEGGEECLQKECPLYNECENIEYLTENIDLYKDCD